MTQKDFAQLISSVTQQLASRPLDCTLEQHLNATFPAGGDVVQEITRACLAAIAQGWMCSREAGGIRFGRVVPPGPDTHGFSVDVVDMDNVVGPHHRHPDGEIDLVMPLTADAKFDGHGAGWCVYGPETAHRPTVSDGRALVLYLLPGGKIEFTRPDPA